MLVALVAIVGTMSIASEAHADHHAGNHANLPLTVEADNSSYDHDSTITVTGQVANVIPGNVPATITVVNPMNSIVALDQVNVSNDGTFETTVNTTGGVWKHDGTYTINVKYGGQSDTVRIDVDVCESRIFINGTNCLPYEISGGIVTGATHNADDNSIIISLDAQDDGTLTVTPSESTQEGIFMVLVDGEEWDDVEINGNAVTVMFPAGAEEIEVIGTFVVPEFGTIASLVLVVAISSIVVLSAKGRLSFTPRI